MNSLLFQAVKDRASDIHIEPFERVAHRPLPHRRHPLRRDLAAEALPAGDHLARQDHGRARHRREAPAAGRPHPHQGRRQGHRRPRLDRSRPPTASASCCACSTAPRRCSASRSSASTGRSLTLVERLIRAEPRHRPGHRPDRQRQDDDALRRALHHQLDRAQHHHHRGSDRVPAAGRRPDAGESQDRPHLRQRAALDPAPGPRRHHGRRDPRPRDRRDRDPGGAHRPPGVLDAAHQRLGERRHPPRRHGHRAVPGLVVGARRHGAAPGAAGLRPVPARASRPTAELLARDRHHAGADRAAARSTPAAPAAPRARRPGTAAGRASTSSSSSTTRCAASS